MAETFEPTAITLQDAASNPTTSFQLTGGWFDRSAAADSTIISFVLLKAEEDVIKADTALAVSQDTTFISFTSAMISDMNYQPITAVPVNDAVEVTHWTDDATHPFVISFLLDLNESTLCMNYSETMNASSLNVNVLSLKGSAHGPTVTLSDFRVTFSGHSSFTSVYS